MTPTLQERVDVLRNANNRTPRISVTELARSNKWREKVYEYAFIEISERNEPCAYLISPDGLSALLETIDQLEDELEQASFRAIMETRRDEDAHWVTGGPEAAAEVEAFFKERYAAVQEAIHGR